MIDVDQLSLRQGNFSITDISLHVPKGRYALLMGKTGCGKTTILEAIAGLRAITTGQIQLNDRVVTYRPPAERGIGYVPQDGALFRTMTVHDNLAFALTIRHQPDAVIKSRVEQLADWLGVSHLLSRYPVGLSGGETQRIALGRALANHPPILLMDEPLSSLDEETRDRMIELLRELPRKADVTVLHITHSRYESEQLGDLIFRLQDGRIEMIRAARPGDAELQSTDISAVPVVQLRTPETPAS
ncbi:MAG: ABC transporter ATP-binding protein [Gemmataceae bacterium]|nr:ABC transporter ATP-binding protein [Gemmataceae bacterium]